MGLASEKRRYIVTSSLIDWAHTQNGSMDAAISKSNLDLSSPRYWQIYPKFIWGIDHIDLFNENKMYEAKRDVWFHKLTLPIPFSMYCLRSRDHGLSGSKSTAFSIFLSIKTLILPAYNNGRMHIIELNVRYDCCDFLTIQLIRNSTQQPSNQAAHFSTTLWTMNSFKWTPLLMIPSFKYILIFKRFVEIYVSKQIYGMLLL